MEETRKAEIHLAQIKELEERQKLLKLQEEQSEEAIVKREESEKVKQKLKQADHLEKWHDGDQADAYLAKFETVLTECDVPKEQWRGRLVNCLTGKALAAYRSVVQGEDSKGYDEMKNQLLEAMGLGIEHPKGKILHGTVGVNPCIMTLDSGADHTVVRLPMLNILAEVAGLVTIMGIREMSLWPKCG